MTQPLTVADVGAAAFNASEAAARAAGGEVAESHVLRLTVDLLGDQLATPESLYAVDMRGHEHRGETCEPYGVLPVGRRVADAVTASVVRSLAPFIARPEEGVEVEVDTHEVEHESKPARRKRK